MLCHNAMRRYAESRYAMRRYAEHRSAMCRYAERRDAERRTFIVMLNVIMPSVFMLRAAFYLLLC
jgi:hypothetical protein